MELIDLSEYINNANSFKLSKERIWTGNNNASKVSYPEEANTICFELEEKSYWYIHRNKCITSVIRSFSSSEYLFDVGGGNGYVSLAIQKMGFKPILIEPDILGAKNAKKRGINNVICAKFDDLTWKKKKIPALGIFDVLEHIKDDIGFLTKINDILAPNGMLYITVPAHQFLWSNEDKRVQHFRRYNLKNLSNKLKSIGFEITYSTYIFSIFPLPIFLFRTIPSYLGFREKNLNLKRTKNELKMDNSLILRILQVFFSKELKKIRSKEKIRFGGTCVIAAKSIK
jgi:2-polyprenyl-3-methyl-5-hydroxy-6-metoxy-1,4-benzoquinol methylase